MPASDSVTVMFSAAVPSVSVAVTVTLVRPASSASVRWEAPTESVIVSPRCTAALTGIPFSAGYWPWLPKSHLAASQPW